MRDQVARHLERARLAARLTVVGFDHRRRRRWSTALARTMEKIHHDRGVAIEVHADEQARFRGERPDLEEMIGNLVDNACKWAASRVAIEVVRERPDPASAGQVVRIVVDDDGRGLSPSEREQVAQRGRRLDETKPGSGLGLSIVVELAGALWRRTQARHRAARRLARRTGAAGELSSDPFGISARVAGLLP